jgi:hypothetical protein
MAKPPALVVVAFWTQLLPAVGTIASLGWRVRGRVLTGLAWMVGLAGDTVQAFLAQQRVNNLWVGYIATALEGLLVLAALATWQTSVRDARIMRIGIVLFVLMWAITLPLAENLTRFSVLTIPLHSVLVLLLSLWTLIRNALEDHPQSLLKSDWFWACTGFALLFGASSAMQPLVGHYLAQARVNDAVAALTFKAGVQVVALLLMTIGMLCPVPTTRSSPSLSPAR